MIKAILFDFDGLIIDTETAWYEAFKETLALYDVELPLEQFVLCIGTDAAVLYEYIASQLGESWSRAEIDKTAAELHGNKMKNAAAREGVQSYLDEAKEAGFKIAIASSSSRKWVTRYLNELGLLDYFDVLVTRDDVEKVKPAPDLYLKAIAALRIDAAEAIVFEDSLNGANAAFSAGLKCVIVPNPVTERLPFEHYNLRLTSMAEKSLLDVIKLIDL